METRPYSAQFEEHYWSSAGGVAEKTYVYLQGNHLKERFFRAADFTVAELGFGTGLNFLLTWKLWEETAPPAAKLSYVAYEKYPPENLAQMHQPFPAELQPYSRKLLEKWPTEKGWNVLKFGRLSLSLYLGDAQEGLATQNQKADAWFLDGFSPARNPQMWSPQLLAAVAEKTNPQGTFATYTVAKAVREALQSSGFSTQKKAGLPPKRHMLAGMLI